LRGWEISSECWSNSWMEFFLTRTNSSMVRHNCEGYLKGQSTPTSRMVSFQCIRF
jgi:hypothetical protein